MRKRIINILLGLFINLCTISVFAQTISISGNVSDKSSKQALPAISIGIKNTTTGTYTDEKGNFKINANSLPVTLIINGLGYEKQEIVISSSSEKINVEMRGTSYMGQEVVIAASRVPERIMESPVTIERINSKAITNNAGPDYYEALSHLNGVDISASSLMFRTITTRGFNSTGNLRLNQYVDGMDNQAPGLSFSVGNLIGMTELDVDNIELLPGASSALYGSGGVNGTLLQTSKDPFQYQGISAIVKSGVMNINNPGQSASPYYDFAIRFAKKVNENLAFKINAGYTRASDWQADDYRDVSRNDITSTVIPGNRQTDPNYDGVNVYGDEVSAGMNAVAQGVLYQATQGYIASYTAQNGVPPSQAQINTYLSTNQMTSGIYAGVTNNVYGKQYISRTGYNENTILDYNTYNFKLSGGLYYKLPRNIEAQIVGYWGSGTSVYTAADRYAIKDFSMGQYKVELKSPTWFLRGYTTHDDAGDSYSATAAGVYINNAWKDNNTWFGEYLTRYALAKLGSVPGITTDAQAHDYARNGAALPGLPAADAGRFLPGSYSFDTALNNVTGKDFSNGGARVHDASSLYNMEGQWNISQYVKYVDVIIGANYRRYILHSNGTIFADSAGPIGINEFGGYLQAQKSLLNDVLKLTVSGRYDKNENFDGRFTPRAAALIKVKKDNNIRLSYQQAYRFPSLQDQWINLQTPVALLIGGLPYFYNKYNFANAPAYTDASIGAYQASVAAGAANASLLQVAKFPTIRPELANSYEIGYRGIPTKSLLIDAYVYYCQYSDYITRTVVGRGQSANPANATMELANPFTTTKYSFVTNSSQQVNATGWGISASYRLDKGYVVSANVSGDNIGSVPAGVITYFNTPDLRYNIGLSNDHAYKNWGFNVLYRWQDKMLWEGTFASGDIPAYGTIDAQISYKIIKYRSFIKLGASNLLNQYYVNAFGNPTIGGLYYISLAYNVF